LSCTPSSGGGGGGGFHSLNGPEYLFNTSQEVVENIFKAELEYEREKRKELERRLDAKDNQVGEVQKRKELERRLDAKDNQVGEAQKRKALERSRAQN
jgi:hypothetical protein